jgi:hypothetical protein
MISYTLAFSSFHFFNNNDYKVNYKNGRVSDLRSVSIKRHQTIPSITTSSATLYHFVRHIISTMSLSSNALEKAKTSGHQHVQDGQAASSFCTPKKNERATS